MISHNSTKLRQKNHAIIIEKTAKYSVSIKGGILQNDYYFS